MPDQQQTEPRSVGWEHATVAVMCLMAAFMMFFWWPALVICIIGEVVALRGAVVGHRAFMQHRIRSGMFASWVCIALAIGLAFPLLAALIELPAMFHGS